MDRDKEYEEWKKKCNLIEEQNKHLLDDFSAYLTESKLSSKTIKKHVSNIDFYINSYLLTYDAVEAREGYIEISPFLGDWFIRKTAWASVGTIKSYATSFKKFYTFLYEKGDISISNLNDVKETVKEDMSLWIKNVEIYWDDY